MPRENVYTCPKCDRYTVTVDVDEGVTAFMIRCRASGNAEDCDGMAQSAFYPKGPRPPHIPAPSWEWYKPGPEELEKLEPGMRQHAENGGLLLRKKGDA